MSRATGDDATAAGKAPSQATELVEMARERYDLGRDPSGEPFALPKSGPRIVRSLRGGQDSLRGELARRYFDKYSKVPSSSALADAILTLGGYALEERPTPLHLRVGETEGAQWLDLGDASGRAVRIDGRGWEIVDEPPLLFRRTELTAALPEPVRGGSLDELWKVVNIPPDDRALALGAVIAELLPNVAHPLVLLLAEHGSGKTTAGKRLAALLDPSPVGPRKPPKDEEAWVTAATGSHVVVVDNVSRIPEWWSDALCRACTGDGDVRRRLYTDTDLVVIAFRRCVWLTTIDLPALRDDLADRAVTINLQALDGHRVRDGELDRRWTQAHPALLGALLDLAAKALAVLPEISCDNLPRMADFYRVLLAVDRVLDTKGAERYLHLAANLTVDLAAGDPLLEALRQDIRTAPFVGTSRELLDKLDQGRWIEERRPREWPANARALSNALTRHAPTLRRLGWTIDKAERCGKLQQVRWTITPPAGAQFDD